MMKKGYVKIEIDPRFWEHHERLMEKILLQLDNDIRRQATTTRAEQHLIEAGLMRSNAKTHVWAHLLKGLADEKR